MADYSFLDPSMFGQSFSPPPIDENLLDFGAQISAKDALPMAPISEPLRAPIAMPNLSASMAPTTGEKIMTGLQQGAPLLAKMGAALMGGKDTTMGQVGNVIAGGLESQALDERMKKTLAQYMNPQQVVGTDPLLGKSVGPTSSQSSSMPDLGATGLTPEQIMAIHKVGFEATSKARTEPSAIALTNAQAHNAIQTGNYHQAQIPYLYAQTQKALEEARLMPAKTMAELAEKNALIAKHIADLQKVSLEMQKLAAETKKLGVDTTRAEAETKQTEETTKKTRKEIQAIDWEKSPAFAQQRSAEKLAGMALSWHNAGNEWVGTDPEGNRMASFPISEAPGGEATPGPAIQHATMLAAGEMLSVALDNLKKKYPTNVQKQMAEYERLLATLKPGINGQVDTTQLYAALNPEQQLAFRSRIDTYSKQYGKKTGTSIGSVPPPSTGAAQPGASAPPPTGQPKTVMDAMVDDVIANTAQMATEQEALDYTIKRHSLSPAGAAEVIKKAKERAAGRGGAPAPKPTSKPTPKPKPTSGLSSPKEAQAAAPSSSALNLEGIDYASRHRELLGAPPEDKRIGGGGGLKIPSFFRFMR